MSYIANALQIIIEFGFGILIALVVLRVLLQLVRANFYNPICQFLYKATNPLLMPFRRIIPAWRRVDLAGIVLAWLVTVLKLILLAAVVGRFLGLGGLAIMAVADLAGFVLMLYLGLILARVLLSFVQIDRRHPLLPLIHQLTEPVLKPIRRRLPTVAGLDFSPLVAWLVILLARALVVQPLLDFGMRLALG
jgi:YggT family protein